MFLRQQKPANAKHLLSIFIPLFGPIFPNMSLKMFALFSYYLGLVIV